MRFWFVILCGLVWGAGNAQAVLYSSVWANAPSTRFEVVGKAGSFYWAQKSRRNSNPKRAIAPWIPDVDFSFDVYDARLNRVHTFANPISDTVLKQYLIAGTHYFDQLLLTKSHDKTGVSVKRFSPDGRLASNVVSLLSVPENTTANDFLLVRSPREDKLLLLAFEPIAESAPRLHVFLFNADWQLLFQNVYTNPNFALPYTQYDFTACPLEAFDNSPVKLASNGDWLMLAPARQRTNFILYHFQLSDGALTETELELAQRTGVQYASLSLDEKRGEALAGIFLNTGAPFIKKVRTAHYVLAQCRFDFDTTYRFCSDAVLKNKQEILFEQSFTAVPGKGFFFLKEYGRLYDPPHNNEPELLHDDTDSVANVKPVPVNKGTYTRYNDFSSARAAYARGDLRLYYFPATRRDSGWSGLVNKPQAGELNSSFLSYAFLPLQDRTIILYNDLSYNNTLSGSTTILDAGGHPTDDGVVFWRANNLLDFQQSRQISPHELVVGYQRSKGLGFAIIRL